MTACFEITDRLIAPGDAAELLYNPLREKCTFRRTRRYHFDYEGNEIKLNGFVADTLVDPVSQTMHGGTAPAIRDARFALDYGMKPGALDLEKEAIVAYYRGLPDPGFSLSDLTIRQRIYVFTESPDTSCTPEIFIRDVCNGAIHNWNIIRD